MKLQMNKRSVVINLSIGGIGAVIGAIWGKTTGCSVDQWVTLFDNGGFMTLALVGLIFVPIMALMGFAFFGEVLASRSNDDQEAK